MTDNNTPATETSKQEGAEQTKTYTQEEVDKLIQSEADKRVTQALEKQKAKQAEAEKLASMTAEEKYKYEYQQKMDELNKREAALNKKELTAEAIKILSEKNLPVDMVDLLVGADAETTQANISKFEKSFNKMIADGVKKTLAGEHTTPKAGSSSGGITKEEFAKMTLVQRANLMKTQPELFKQLSNE